MSDHEDDRFAGGLPKFWKTFRATLDDERLWESSLTTLPWVNVFRKSPTTTNAIHRAALKGRPAHLATIQGSRCRYDQEFLRCWGDALEFPWYYGKNWDAFNECFGDLFELKYGGLGSGYRDRPGRPVEQLVLVVDRAEEVLTGGDVVPAARLLNFLE